MRFEISKEITPGLRVHRSSGIHLDASNLEWVVLERDPLDMCPREPNILGMHHLQQLNEYP